MRLVDGRLQHGVIFGDRLNSNGISHTQLPRFCGSLASISRLNRVAIYAGELCRAGFDKLILRQAQDEVFSLT
jgi:hypothetical protein